MAHFWRCSPHPTPTSPSPCPEHAHLPQTLAHLHAPGHLRVGVLNLVFPGLLSQDIAMMSALVLCTCIIIAMSDSLLAARASSVVSALCVGCLCSHLSAVKPPQFCCWGQRWPWRQPGPEPQTGCSGDFCNTSF